MGRLRCSFGRRVILNFASPAAILAAVATVAASLALPGSAVANPGIDRWGGIVFFCSPPIPAKDWGTDACAFLAEEAARQAAAQNVPLVAVSAAAAGLTGGPEGGKPSFPWPKALRLLAKYDGTASASYPWSLTFVFYEYPADAGGEHAENRWQAVYQQSATLLDGQELEGTRQTAPVILDGGLQHLFGSP